MTEIKTTQWVYREKLLKVLYFENSFPWSIFTFLGFSSLNPSDIVETLEYWRQKTSQAVFK